MDSLVEALEGLLNPVPAPMPAHIRRPRPYVKRPR